MNNQPIGILDSGVGGFSIWREIVKELPNESTIYLADSINCPYGNKREEEIYFLARRLVSFLIEKKVKVIVLACNTITVSCIDKLRAEFKSLPFVGLVPAVKTAGEITRSKRIGILSTPITAESDYQKQLIDRFAKDCLVINIGTEELVPYIERGNTDSKNLKKTMKKILNEFIVKDADVIALGCSHFPFLKEQMQKILGRSILVIDSGVAIARQVRRVLTNNKTLSPSSSSSDVFYTTGNVKEFTQASKKLVGEEFEELISSVQAISL